MEDEVIPRTDRPSDSARPADPEGEGQGRVSILGVRYVHTRFPSGDEIYVTEHGIAYRAQLHPENFWTDQIWFRDHSTRLSGTSTIFRITTRRDGGPGREIVLKWNRMGQEVPGGEFLCDDLPVEFNSPFEEFALVTELRASVNNGRRVMTHRPLAIYVPAGTVSLDRSGRKERLMEPKIAAHKEVVLDICRNYAVIYEWMDGIDAADACKTGLISSPQMEQRALQAAADLHARGFVVGDNKPHHVIIRPGKGGYLRRDRAGRLLYGLVDFELLARTPQREATRRSARRSAYLMKQKDRFKTAPSVSFPAHLTPVRLGGVDYVYGRVPTTGGALWVVGKDPDLFDYFLPEKWEGTARKKLSHSQGMYYTLTKDHIHLVWKLSQVGQKPHVDPFRENEQRMLEYGYNSPFEKFSMAMELANKGIPTIYPRAIYMAGRGSHLPAEMRDHSRYRSHAQIRTPEGTHLLLPDRDYFVIWGYWNGPDEMLAESDSDYCEGISALNALRRGLLSRGEYLQLVGRQAAALAEAGFEDLNLTGSHILLSLSPEGSLLTGPDGKPEAHVCNFDLLRWTGDGGRQPF